jgi:hypothetical protein
MAEIYLSKTLIMIKFLARLICMMFLLAVTASSIAQSKPAPKTKPAASSKKPVKPADKKTEAKVEDEKPPEVEELEKTVIPPPALPPLPEIDTTAAPNDELTKEIKKLLVVTNALGASDLLMKGALESQRKNNTSLPDEFYARMLQGIEKGEIGHYLENVVIKIYRQKFTIEEVKEVIKFYDSPVGKKMAAEAGPIANAARIEGEKIGQYMAIKIIGDMVKEGKWK